MLWKVFQTRNFNDEEKKRPIKINTSVVSSSLLQSIFLWLDRQLSWTRIYSELYFVNHVA